MDKKYLLDSYLIHFDWMESSVWSYSRVCCYDGCPRQFKYTYIDRLEGEDTFVYSEPLIKGSYIHSRLECLFSYTVNKTPVSLYDPFQHNNGSTINITDSHKESWETILSKCCKSPEFFNLLNSSLESEYLCTEFELQYKNLFKGYIDLIFVSNGTLYIIDWKTGKKRDYDFYQTATYAYCFLALYEDKYTIKRVHIQYFFIEEPEYELAVDQSVDEFLESYLYVLEWYKSVMDLIKKEDIKVGYIPNSKSWKRCTDEINSFECKWCPMRSYCEEDRIKDATSLSIKVKPSDANQYIK